MMRRIVASSLKFRYLVVALAAGMMFFGVGRLHQMPVDVFPEFAPPMVEVQTICIGLSSTEVEGLVSVPLEQVFAGIPGLDILRSKSVEQLSSVKMIFKPGTDLLLARQAVQERVAQITPTLPTWAAPPVMLPPLSATARVMKIGISSDKLSVIDLSMITYWTIRQRIMRVPGVANVAMWGERLQNLNVEVVPELMKTAQGLAGRGHGDHRRFPGYGVAAFLQGSLHRQGRVARDRQSAAPHPARQPRPHEVR